MAALPVAVWAIIISALSLLISILGVVIPIVRDRVDLQITQLGGQVENSIAPVDRGFAWSYMIVVRIINASRTKTITLNGFDLTLDWNDQDFRLLPDPVMVYGEQRPYRVSETLSFPYKEVINHRVGVNGILKPGDTIEGLFLARGLTPPPYDPGVEADLQFIIYDELWKPHKQLFRFLIRSI